LMTEFFVMEDNSQNIDKDYVIKQKLPR
jgi:hypothetical protein